MIKNSLAIFLFLICKISFAQKLDLQKEDSHLSYQQSRAVIVEKFKNLKPGKFGESVLGIKARIATTKKIVAFTFDACGGPTGSEFDSVLIEFLKKERIPATLFVSGSWIEQNDSIFEQLCREPLFEIENHGMSHCPCSISNRNKYGIEGTDGIGSAFDEIEMNANLIGSYTNKKPQFYRPAAAVADEGCVAIARELKERIISYDVLSGDAVKGTSIDLIKKNVLKKVKPGSIIIMHMNHPERNGFEALREIIPVLKKQGYEFVKLEGHSLVGKK